MSALQTLARSLGHRRWFAATARFLVPVDRLIARVTRGRVIGFGVMPSLVITTTGRRSGQPRANPLLYVPDGDGFVVIGSNWGQRHHPAWVLNLLADPAAVISVGGERIAVRAELGSGAERDRLWQLLVAQWPAYQTYLDRAAGRDLRVFRLHPRR